MGSGILGRILLSFSAVYHRLRSLLSPDHRLHQSRFARTDELRLLLQDTPGADGLLLGKGKSGHVVTVVPTQTRRELGNLLIVGPTRSGKGLLATSQLLILETFRGCQ